MFVLVPNVAASPTRALLRERDKRESERARVCACVCEKESC